MIAIITMKYLSHFELARQYGNNILLSFKITLPHLEIITLFWHCHCSIKVCQSYPTSLFPRHFEIIFDFITLVYQNKPKRSVFYTCLTFPTVKKTLRKRCGKVVTSYNKYTTLQRRWCHNSVLQRCSKVDSTYISLVKLKKYWECRSDNTAPAR